MSSIKKLVYCMFLHLVFARLQINLDLTDTVTNTEETNLMWQYNCLHVLATIRYTGQPLEMIYYCMNEWSPRWDIIENNLDQKFTFAELSNLSITSEQLYLWSAPMDVVEQYQIYLNPQLSTSNNLSLLAKEIFYNCTSPRFGLLCEYSFDGYEPYSLSLSNIISDFYSRAYQPTTMTCYLHLHCNRGHSSICLDWTEICDGHIDCLNDGVDEEHCWQLVINECNDNEYRCMNGQCISETFRYDDNYQAFDCLDRHDESINRRTPENKLLLEPTFTHEDVLCVRIAPLQSPFTTSCVKNRHSLIIESMFSNESKMLSDRCWHAIRCSFQFPNANRLKCHDICPNKLSCQEIINRTCPDIFFIPDFPILFGHIYLAYTKQAAIQPSGMNFLPTYICYNDQLCSEFVSNRTLLSFNNSTCRQPRDIPLSFFPDAVGVWSHRNIRLIYDKTFICNVMVQNNDVVCNSSIMYQCINSSKCISHHRVGDRIKDCNNGDDEKQNTINDVCLKDRLDLFFKCTNTNKCITQRALQSSECDCGRDEDNLCDDEDPAYRYIRKHISFPNICDGFTDLLPVLIDGQYETDETECELWQCNNTYTRCNDIWNCLDGADEINCRSSPLLNCSQEHRCISIYTNQPMCLTVDKGNDNNIDCVGATDEPQLCQLNRRFPSKTFFYCHNRTFQPCIPFEALCFTDEQYPNDNKIEFCSQIKTLNIYFMKRSTRCAPVDSDIEEFFQEYPKEIDRSPPLYFTLDKVEKSSESTSLQTTKTIIQRSSFKLVPGQIRQRCHRGLPLRVWIDKEKNITNITCLCPPSFYGNICQYQNQRVSLTMKLQTYSDSRRILFTILVSLIDDSNERIIHSYHQFTFLYIQYCRVKFNIYLLYSTQPKNDLRNYSLHIDFYEKLTFIYRGSSFIPIQFPFLPVHRIATLLNIPSTNEDMDTCTQQQCIHGRCMKYSHDFNETTFCHCHQGWSGRYCNISYTCTCSNNSLCAGISANKRSICICPMNKFGPRCLLDNTICQSNANETCYNNGECVPVDEHLTVNQKFFCICRKGFTGDRCEISDTKIILSFNNDIALPQWMTVHFIGVVDNTVPENGSTFATISTHQKTAIVHWRFPFHIAFMKLFNHTYYLIIVQNTYNRSATITRTITSSDRCKHLNELLNKTIVDFHLLRRIKYYHFVCQKYSIALSCFYDDDHFCLCEHSGHRHLANCFEFDQKQKFNCFGYSKCQNDAECIDDRSSCPQTSMCVCRTCFYGKQCQFTSDGFGLSLDGILGYHIQPHSSIKHQPTIIQVSVVLTIIMTVAGLVNSVLMMITFKSEGPRKVGCGLYLLCSSITTLLISVIFALKFSILIIAQITYVTNKSFLRSQCVSIDFFLRTGLQIDQWLQACVAMERTMSAIKGVKFNKGKSKQTAKYIILFLFVSIIITTLPDPFHRRLIYDDDDDDDNENKRIWCIVVYSSAFKTLTSYVNIFHSLAPFIINIISAIIIIVTTARRRTSVHAHQSYRHVVLEQLREHKHLLISSIALIILALPRLIISFVSGCMKSMDDSEVFLAGYFISFIPSALTFAVFVLPSKSYKEEFWQAIRRYQLQLRTFYISLHHSS